LELASLLFKLHAEYRASNVTISSINMSETPKSAAQAGLRRVLFVDDDKRFLETLRELMSVLSEGHWEVITAESPNRAFAILRETSVDLTVVDVQMGVMDGIQMLSMLNRGFPTVQKVVLTGFANEKYRAACLSNGAELYLEKPTNPAGWQELYGVLNELLKMRPEEGFRGVLRRVGLPDVIQMECLARSSSILEVSNVKQSGQIFIETGQIIHAQVGDLAGEDAFNQLLSFSGGQFNLKPFVEPSARSITGQWEFLLMEAARKSDELKESAAAAGENAAAESEQLLAATEPSPVTSPKSIAFAPTYESIPALPPNVASRPRVDEMLICSVKGEVMYDWQCINPNLWVGFIEFISQRVQRITQMLPVGDFNRIEIESGGARMVVAVSPTEGVMVRTRREPLNQVIR
jgi:CheY-like chemotaxis protein